MPTNTCRGCEYDFEDDELRSGLCQGCWGERGDYEQDESEDVMPVDAFMNLAKKRWGRS